MKLVFTIDRDVSPARLEEYKRVLNVLIGYDAEWRETVSVQRPGITVRECTESEQNAGESGYKHE